MIWIFICFYDQDRAVIYTLFIDYNISKQISHWSHHYHNDDNSMWFSCAECTDRSVMMSFHQSQSVCIMWQLMSFGKYDAWEVTRSGIGCREQLLLTSWVDPRSHYSDVIMGAIASQITSLTVVHSTVYSDADQRKHQSSASLAFVWGPVNSPRKWPVKRKMFPFDDVIMHMTGRLWGEMLPVTCPQIKHKWWFLWWWSKFRRTYQSKIHTIDTFGHHLNVHNRKVQK